MSKEVKDPKEQLAELAAEHAKLAAAKDKKSRFRCRMIAGRAKSLIRQLHKSAVDQDFALAEWDKKAKPQRIGAGFFPIED